MTGNDRARLPANPSASSLEVSIYDYTGEPVSASSSRAADAQEDLATKAKTLADKCWQEDDSFLAKDKIAEWLGGR